MVFCLLDENHALMFAFFIAISLDSLSWSYKELVSKIRSLQNVQITAIASGCKSSKMWGAVGDPVLSLDGCSFVGHELLAGVW